MNETLDVSRADIDTLLRRVEQRALLRRHGELTCADIMSRDVVSVSAEGSPTEAKALLLKHDIRTLPVVDSEKRLLGTVGLRELANAQQSEVLPISEAVTARPDEAAVGLLPRLTDGVAHAVMVVDRAYHVVGVISQTDLLATLGKSLAHNSTPGIMRGAGQGI
jgi:CBS domain-containing membrane protein